MQNSFTALQLAKCQKQDEQQQEKEARPAVHH